MNERSDQSLCAIRCSNSPMYLGTAPLDGDWIIEETLCR